jgi:hypothetical protein
MPRNPRYTARKNDNRLIDLMLQAKKAAGGRDATKDR